MSNDQKKVWITGASSGIGKAVAEKFAKENWKVAISARRKEILNEIAKNSNIISYPLDVTDENQTQDTFNKIIKDFGDIDLCIFSSGTYERKSEKGLNVNNVKNVMDVNFLGVVRCIKAVQEYFQNKKNGHISIVSSPVGYRGLPTAGAYGLTKAGLINLAESLYFDMQKNKIKISVINPGFIESKSTNLNTFPMPFIKSAEFAANKIFQGLTKSYKFEIYFPFFFLLIMKIGRILPYRLYFYLIRKITKL